MVSLLIANSFFCDNQLNKDGNLPIHLAIKSSDIEMIKVIIAHDSIWWGRQNKDGDYPIHLAIKFSNIETV